MLIISCILIIVSVWLVLYSIYNLRHTKQVNTEIEQYNQQLKETEFQLSQIIKEKSLTLNQLEDYISNQQKQLNNIQLNITQTIDAQKQMSQIAFENYCEILDNEYKEAEEEHNMEMNALQTAYSNLQLRLMQETDEVKSELDKIKATRAAAIQAQLKEKEIKEQLAFYCLTINQSELDDIQVLERMKSQLHNPRILSMLIWSTYFQKPMTTLCNNIIGIHPQCGIYKITNQKNNMCYIGQAVDLARRWKDHAKCGLGIDTPQNNKLYQSMIEDGLWNFSFEVLELCPRELLNEKEKYYIQLYQSYDFGFNSNKGIT